MTILIHNLDHTYSDGRKALRGLTLSIIAGERVGLVGCNGAGKTTLLHRICGAILGASHDNGSIQVMGLDPAKPEERRQLPSQVGMVFQNPDDQLFSTTVREDVAFGPLNLGLGIKEACLRAETALEETGLTGFGDRSPNRLSGGEKRRAALAGIFAMRPHVLLLDEPTQFLDHRGRQELLAILQSQTATILTASHDFTFLRSLCTRIVLLENGSVAGEYTPQELDEGFWARRELSSHT